MRLDDQDSLASPHHPLAAYSLTRRREKPIGQPWVRAVSKYGVPISSAIFPAHPIEEVTV